MVISTVSKTIYEFFELHPEVVILIVPRNEKLKQFYNTIFRRRYKEVEKTFKLVGIYKNISTPYNREKKYDKFEIQLKKL